MTTSRHLSRIIALEALFAFEFHGGVQNEVFDYVANEFKEKTTDFAYAKVLFDGVVEHGEKIREVIVTHAPDWPVEKIAKSDRVVLEIAIFEMNFGGDVPAVVALDEAIELAKQYGSPNAPKFINGVLNALLNNNRTPRESPSA